MKNNKKGFTLAELLVVVAIIGILVAVSIPIFTAQLEKAREATDLANMRAAKAAAVAAYLGDTGTGDATYYYDAQNGTVAAAKGTTDGFKYGKGTTVVGSTANTAMGYDPKLGYADKCVKVVIKGGDTSTVTISWE